MSRIILYVSNPHNVPHTVRRVLASPFIGLVYVYRLVLSPDHGPLRHLFPYGYCRHEPTCSTYALHQLRERWLPVALYKISARLLSCHPWRKLDERKLRAMTQEKDPV